MLREAEACGLRLDPTGVALQTALNRVKAIKDNNLIPAELIDLLNKDLKRVKRTSDERTKDTAEIEQYLRDHLQPDQIRRIVDLAADSDSADWDAQDGKGGEMPQDLLEPFHESLVGAWNLAEPLSFERTREGGGTKWT
jgi:hypothetical protein